MMVLQIFNFKIVHFNVKIKERHTFSGLRSNVIQ